MAHSIESVLKYCQFNPLTSLKIITCAEKYIPENLVLPEKIYMYAYHIYVYMYICENNY